jgi:hypothetical protein
VGLFVRNHCKVCDVVRAQFLELSAHYSPEVKFVLLNVDGADSDPMATTTTANNHNNNTSATKGAGGGGGGGSGSGGGGGSGESSGGGDDGPGLVKVRSSWCLMHELSGALGSCLACAWFSQLSKPGGCCCSFLRRVCLRPTPLLALAT